MCVVYVNMYTMDSTDISSSYIAEAKLIISLLVCLRSHKQIVEVQQTISCSGQTQLNDDSSKDPGCHWSGEVNELVTETHLA